MLTQKVRKFQKRVTIILALLAVLSFAAKKRGPNPFPRGSGVFLNVPMDQFDEDSKNLDHLMFLYVFDSDQDKSEQMTQQIINPTIEELKGYAKFYAFDCQDPDVRASKRFTMCDKEEYTPFFQLLKPPEVKINPYTNQPMQAQSIPFGENQVTQKKVYNFILNNLPDYSVNVDTASKLEDFKDSKDDKDINKVILFSKKTKTPPIFKVLSAEYRDRIKFGFIQSEKQEVVAKFSDVADFPTLLVIKTYDPDTNTTLEKPEILKYGKKEYKLDELKEFLGPNTRDTKKVYPEKQKSKSTEKESAKDEADRRKKPYVEMSNDRQFNTHILDNEKACLVFYILSSNVTSEVPLFEKIMRETQGALQVGVFYLNESSPDFAEVKKKYKLGNKFPQMRFYKNNIFGEDKNLKSYEIYLKNKLDVIIEEIDDGLDHDVREVSEKILNNMAITYAVEEKKNVIFYFYNEGRVSIHFKALSTMSILKEDFVFMSVTDPSQQLVEGFQITSMPKIGGILAATNDDASSVKQFSYGGSITFDEVLQNLLQLSGKQEEFAQQQKNRAKQRERKFEEITNTQKFQTNCVDKQKGCAIAFLPGNQILDYERENQKEYIATLEQLEKEAKTLPLYYMWVNASCHSYLLNQFDVNPMFVPTVVFYLPGKGKSAHLIGKFDKETIQKHEQKFINGKLPTFDMTVKATELEIKDLDCPNLQPEGLEEADSSSDKELEDEILQEILREEEERKREEETEEKSAGKKGGKKGKKGKKGKSSGAQKDDL